MIVRLWLAVLMAEQLSVIATRPQMDDLLPRGTGPKTLNLILIPYDTAYTGMVNKSTSEYYFLIHQDVERTLSVTVTPCNTRLNWDLKFIPLTSNQSIILSRRSSDYGKLLIEYTGVPTSITFNHPGKAFRGLYVITIQATDDESKVMFYVSLKHKSQKKQFGFRPNGIKIKKGGQKISLRWNLSHIDHHLMKYSLVISTSKIYNTLCEAESRLEEKQKFNLNSNDSEDDLSLFDRLDIFYLGFSTNYTLTDLIYDKTYYFTVFAINGSDMAIQHANATYKFQKPKPISLKDAKPEVVNLRAQSGKVSFRYKVGSRSLEADGDTKTLYWYVMPCGGVVNVEIRCRKTLLVKKRVFGYEKIILNNTIFGERYVMKVETVSIDETQRVRSIEVMATVRPKMFPMPDMPNDLSIKQFMKSDDCRSITIGWLSAKSNTNLQYCVYVEEYRQSNSVDFSVKTDQCELLYVNSKRRDVYSNFRRKKRCYIGGKEEVSVEKLLKLKSLTTYIIQVTVTKPKGKTLSYDLLMLDTNSCGLN